MKRITVLILTLLLLLSGCALTGQIDAGFDRDTRSDITLEILYENGKKIGVATGSKADNVVRAEFTNAEVIQYATVGEGFIAVKTGKIDAFCYDRAVMLHTVAENPDLTLINEVITQNDLAIGIREGLRDLKEDVNEVIRELTDDGTIDEMKARWLEGEPNPMMPEIDVITNPDRTLIVGTSYENRPMCYLDADGNPTGFDVEFARRLAYELGFGVEFRVMDWPALIPTLKSDKVDMIIATLNSTEERKRNMVLTDPYVYADIVMMVRNHNSQAEIMPFWENIKESFYQNLIVENRWKLVTDGLCVTMIISVFAMILGTLLGFLICFMTLSKLKILGIVAKIYTVLLRGTPIVVLLMIIFYIIFAKVNINPVLVAIIAFGLNAGAFVGGLARTAILTVDKGQIEAARSMGFGSMGAFFLVTLPQASRVALPIYKSEFVSLVKATAVVGYIAIMDLTKAGDIIRSRTYDAFFPLIAVALVYFIITGAVILLFGYIEKRTDKRGRRKNV